MVWRQELLNQIIIFLKTFLSVNSHINKMFHKTNENQGFHRHILQQRAKKHHRQLSWVL